MSSGYSCCDQPVIDELCYNCSSEELLLSWSVVYEDCCYRACVFTCFSVLSSALMLVRNTPNTVRLTARRDYHMNLYVTKIILCCLKI